MLGNRLCHTFCVNELWVKIDSTFPFNCIEANAYLSENFVFLKPTKYTQIQKRFHIKDTLFAIFENDAKGVIFMRMDFLNNWIHCGASIDAGIKYRQNFVKEII